MIYPGEWQLWSSYNISFQSCETIAYNRAAIRHHLQLDADQMPVLAALCGNDRLHHWQLAAFHRSIGNIGENFFLRFETCAIFVRENDLRSHRRPSEYISELAVRHGFDETLFWRAVDIYDVLNNHDADSQTDLMAAQLQRDAYGCSAVLAFLPPFVNAMSMSTFDMRIPRFVGVETLLLPLIRRQAGVAWLDHRDKTGDHAKVCSMIRTRLSPNDESTKVIELDPEFPPCEYEIMLSKWNICQNFIGFFS